MRCWDGFQSCCPAIVVALSVVFVTWYRFWRIEQVLWVSPVWRLWRHWFNKKGWDRLVESHSYDLRVFKVPWWVSLISCHQTQKEEVTWILKHRNSHSVTERLMWRWRWKCPGLGDGQTAGTPWQKLGDRTMRQVGQQKKGETWEAGVRIFFAGLRWWVRYVGSREGQLPLVQSRHRRQDCRVGWG